jgi:hypothetical protein
MSGIPGAQFFRKRPSARCVNLPACRKSNRTFSGTGLDPYKALPSGSSCLKLALDVRRKHNYLGVAILMHGAASLVDYGAAQVHRPLTHNAVQTGDLLSFMTSHKQPRGEGCRKDATRRTDIGLSFSVPNEKNVAANLLRRWTRKFGMLRGRVQYIG